MSYEDFSTSAHKCVIVQMSHFATTTTRAHFPQREIATLIGTLMKARLLLYSHPLLDRLTPLGNADRMRARARVIGDLNCHSSPSHPPNFFASHLDASKRLFHAVRSFRAPFSQRLDRLRTARAIYNRRKTIGYRRTRRICTGA